MAAKRSSKEYSNAEAVDIIHQVANLYISTKVPQDYGTGEEYTSVEVHTLKHIADNPGITVTELARHNGKRVWFAGKRPMEITNYRCF